MSIATQSKAFLADVKEWFPFLLPPEREYLLGNDNGFLIGEIPNATMTCAGVYFLQQPLTADQGRALADDFAGFIGDRYLKKLVRNEWLFGRPYWQIDEAFDINNHFKFRSFPKETTTAELQSSIADFISSQYDWDHPLWGMFLIDHGGKSLVVWRFHHSITDGQGSTKAVLKWTASYDAQAGKAVLGRTSTEEIAALQFKAGAKVKANIAARGGGGRRRSIVEETKTFTDRLILAIKSLLVLIYSIFLYLQNMIFIGFFANTIRRKAPWSSKQQARLQGLPQKQLAWSEPVPLEALKRAKDIVGCTVNDIMVGLLVGALQKALKEKAQLKDSHLVFLVPTSYRPERDFTVTNQSSGYILSVPTHFASPTARSLEVSKRMKLLKQSVEPLVGYHSQRGLWFPWIFAKAVTLTGMGKLHGVISNVPGPQQKLQFGPATVDDMFPVGPPNGPGGMNMTILSYGTNVTLTFYMDVDPSLDKNSSEWYAPKDASRVCELFTEEYLKLEQECLEKEEERVRDAVKRLGKDKVLELVK